MQFLMRYYTPGDDIFFFGFSRGAYTARFLAEMLDHVGLLSVRLPHIHANAELTISGWKRRDVPLRLEVRITYPISSLDADYTLGPFRNGNVGWRATKRRRGRRKNFSSTCVLSERPSVVQCGLSDSLVSSIRSTASHISRTHGCSVANSHTRHEVQPA